MGGFIGIIWVGCVLHCTELHPGLPTGNSARLVWAVNLSRWTSIYWTFPARWLEVASEGIYCLPSVEVWCFSNRALISASCWERFEWNGWALDEVWTCICNSLQACFACLREKKQVLEVIYQVVVNYTMPVTRRIRLHDLQTVSWNLVSTTTKLWAGEAAKSKCFCITSVCFFLNQILHE